MKLDLDFLNPPPVFAQLVQVHMMRDLRRELRPRTSATPALVRSVQPTHLRPNAALDVLANLRGDQTVDLGTQDLPDVGLDALLHVGHRPLHRCVLLHVLGSHALANIVYLKETSSMNSQQRIQNPL